MQRFLPSEFGHDTDRANPVEPGLTMYNEKRLIRRVIEEAGIPYTNICCNSIASWPYHDNCHPSMVPPPIDQLQIYGDGNVKGITIIHDVYFTKLYESHSLWWDPLLKSVLITYYLVMFDFFFTFYF